MVFVLILLLHYDSYIFKQSALVGSNLNSRLQRKKNASTKMNSTHFAYNMIHAELRRSVRTHIIYASVSLFSFLIP